MIIATVKIMPLEQKRQDILDILLCIKEPVMAEPGCLCCDIFIEVSEMNSILYVEHWRSMPEFEQHMKESNYGKVLEVMELSAQCPQVSFYSTNKMWSFELVERLRPVNWN